ncbi:MAG: GNAT family N-acetyltransferase [Chloroflexota bacterium]|nr:GNAT family N-acetyltransferase [Chloroflexota bacterium]
MSRTDSERDSGSVAKLERVAVALPVGLRVRVQEEKDLEHALAFQNRFARPARRQSLEDARRWEKNNPQPKRLILLVQDGAGEIVALGSTTDGGVFAREDGTFRLGLRVAPEWRRSGVGSALLGALEAHGKEAGATRLTTTVRGDEPEGLAFATRHGYEEYHREVTSYVQLQRFDGRGFPAAEETAAQAGLRLATYAEIAMERADDLEAFQRQLYGVICEVAYDIPSAEPVVNPPFEAIRHMYFGDKSFDHPTSILALRDGRVVGSTITTVNDVGAAYTVHTGVLRRERGKGIATALKLRAIRALRAAGVQLYGTTNDEANVAMRGINRRLGYEPDPPSVHVRKDLH